MSISACGSTCGLFFVDGNVVQDVVGLGQEMGLEEHLLRFRVGVDEGADLVRRESFRSPIPVCLVEELALVALISIAQYVAIYARQLGSLAAFPELAYGEIPAEKLRVHARGRGKQAGKERLRPMKLCRVGSRIDQLELRQAAKQGLMVFEVGEEADKAITTKVAIDKRGDRMIGARFWMMQEYGKAVHEIAFRYRL